MAEKLGIYKCDKCGNIAEVLHGEKPPLQCCDQSMILLKENSVDAAKEKHVPVIEKIEGGYLVKLGSVAHPMEDKHFIEWIEINAEGVEYRKFLKPGDDPEAKFLIDAASVTARAYCNLHGFWKS
ncbi:MAG: desulfoferrodoxin [Thermodesulfobacteriota bacterium]|nr:desulfoferrodoxin [Thermodesulfobacteriota bacterium]